MFARLVVNYPLIALLVVVGVIVVLGPVLLLTYWLTRDKSDTER